jgi:ribosome-associated toxin RatA of RatAB toxin-antitoxin module
MNYTSITATAQGIVTYSDNGSEFIKYDKLVQNKKIVSPKIQKTQDSIYLNLIQRQMYRRLMYGLKEYTPEQIASFSPSTLNRIVNDYKKAKQFLQIMKAKKLFHCETRIINAICLSDIGKKDYDWYLDLPKHITLRNLKITTKDVCDEFITRKLLPKNFYNINQQQIQLP